MTARTLAALALIAVAALLGGCDRCGKWDFSVCEKIEAR
jgi:hypothetical protein